MMSYEDFHKLNTLPRPRYGRILTDEQENVIRSDYLADALLTHICKQYKLSTNCVVGALRRTKTPTRTTSEAFYLFNKMDCGKEKALLNRDRLRKYTVNNNFFDESLNPVSAYVLGFWLADGHMETDIDRISFSQMESIILEKIKSVMEATYPVYKSNKYENKYKLSILSTNLCNSIKKLCNNYDTINKKSYTATYPSIPESLHSHFIRGVFDGDGCLSFTDRKKGASFSIVGTEKLNIEIQKILIKYCDCSNTKLKHINSTTTLAYSGNWQVLRILDWLYKDADIYLDRKHDKYIKLKHYQTKRYHHTNEDYITMTTVPSKNNSSLSTKRVKFYKCDLVKWPVFLTVWNLLNKIKLLESNSNKCPYCSRITPPERTNQKDSWMNHIFRTHVNEKIVSITNSIWNDLIYTNNKITGYYENEQCLVDKIKNILLVKGFLQ